MKKVLFVGGTGWVAEAFFSFIIRKKKYFRDLKLYSISRNKKKKKLDKVNYTFKDIKKIEYLEFFDYIIYGLDIHSSRIDKFLKLINFKRFKKSKIIYLSSGSVYGANSISPKQEKEIDNKNIKFLNKFKNVYASRKISSEKKIVNFSKKNFDFTIIRLFNLVGPNIPLKKNFAVGNFIYNILSGKTIKSNTKRITIRGYLHSDTFSELLLKLLQRKDNKKIKFFNIGSSKKIRIDRLVKKLAKDFKLKFYFSNKLDLRLKPDIYLSNNKKIKKKFKKVNFVEGYPAIIKTIKFLKFGRNL